MRITLSVTLPQGALEQVHKPSQLTIPAPEGRKVDGNIALA